MNKTTLHNAWLRLLLCAPDACVPGAVAGAGLRDPAVRQDQRCRSVARDAGPARLSLRVDRAGGNTDAYQPIERELRITRDVLQVLHDCDHPVGLITKSSLIERDIDLLAPMAAKNLAVAAVTITTLDAELARKLEPRAATPSRRLRAMRTLAEAGIPVGVSVAPVIPFITDDHLEQILEAAREAGAMFASYIVLRLPHELAPVFQDWLAAHFPDRAQRVMNRIRDLHGGKDYNADSAPACAAPPASGPTCCASASTRLPTSSASAITATTS
nr:radical SAM protein [Ralstonia solanacearum]